MTMFQPGSLGTLTLKHRILLRYKRVQEYEKRRREETLAYHEQPQLGQLEYGNANYKIALQATNVITAYDIGTLQDPSTISKRDIPSSTYHPIKGPLLVFGTFKEPFADAVIPSETARAYKKPLRWPVPGSEKRWKQFEHEQLRSLQNADAGN
ncbi:hypothetical protein N0V83_000542 [Neocucurbitaria cava]|uniref:Uncharacterized protein n=1 Tax=Neocucurbitaria cava TaxID=798079 RepID=A0A9W8YIW2_9PLEO|nr:hypothetical protein N0V83_000542 [Neocucurbitaria cava]